VTLNGRATRDMSLRSRSTTMTLFSAPLAELQHLGLIGIAVGVYTSRSGFMGRQQPSCFGSAAFQSKNNS
jgi:hypothetical protein